jgi:sugar phosphate isomerase/epimerase
MIIPNTNDGSTNPPRLRLDINGANIFGLPATSSLHGDDRALLQAVKAAGFEGVQTSAKAELCRELGLRVTGSARIDTPEDADARAREATDLGADCCTVHVGWGIEDDDEVSRLVEATLRASEARRIPIYIETHRATITQDMFRTVQLTQRFPEIRFNGDFSHWYTGQEMVYGDIEAKWRFIQPVFDRVRFIHGRIGNPGCMQVDIGDGTGRTYVDHFREMWTRSFTGFLRSARRGDYICFTPELLGTGAYYARTFPNASGEMAEESDRWQQAKLYASIARECFAEAQLRVKSESNPT